METIEFKHLVNRVKTKGDKESYKKLLIWYDDKFGKPSKLYTSLLKLRRHLK